jgi:hypothetical protein
MANTAAKARYAKDPSKKKKSAAKRHASIKITETPEEAQKRRDRSASNQRKYRAAPKNAGKCP